MIEQFISWVARRNFARALSFSNEGKIILPDPPRDRSCLLYLHVPFCEKLCPYCSFNRMTFDESLCREYFRALRKEVKLYKEKGFDFKGVYVGGGTPTVLINELCETLSAVKDSFSIREISVETNPNHLTEQNINLLKQVGVNRLSVGVQSFDDGLLKAMERYEKYGSGRIIAARLKELGGIFNTLNADMIFNFPGQTREMLERDIEMLLGTNIDQVTYYPLMLSDGTRLLVEKAMGRSPGTHEREFYKTITDRLIPPYDYSSAWCFSKKKGMIDEYVVDYSDYAGLGSGSIGYISGVCYANSFAVRDYIDRVNKGEFPVMAGRCFSSKDQIMYDFVMKLFGGRLRATEMRTKYGGSWGRSVLLIITAFRASGAVGYDSVADEYYLTPKGRYYWVMIMREFFTAVNNFRDFCKA